MMKLSENPYIKLLRVNHWFKNLFIFFGVVYAFWIGDNSLNILLIIKILGAFFLASFVSSANYIINQIADKEFDKKHPLKKQRPIPSGKISIELPFFLSLVIFLVSFGIANLYYSFNFSVLIFIFWIAGIIYNIKPLRLKDVPYLDVISESANNPIRFLIGWLVIMPNTFPHLEILIFSWSAGAVLMTAKRYDELFYHGRGLVPYRQTFGTYSLTKLKKLLIFYTIVSFALFSSFIYTYQHKLIWITPMIFAYLVWLLNAIITGRAKARNIEEFVLTKEFMALSGSLLIVILVMTYLTKQ